MRSATQQHFEHIPEKRTPVFREGHATAKEYGARSGCLAVEGSDDQWIDSGCARRRLHGVTIGRSAEKPLTDGRMR
jgi:hypothetical protein